MNKKTLWLRLQEYNFDNLIPSNAWQKAKKMLVGENAPTQAFAAKIARKHGIKHALALKAIAEYKKFVYLGVVSDFAVTPSKIIDFVWHEHLLFSKAYREFCLEVLHYDFDHSPELIALKEQTAQYNAQYTDTLSLYKKEFGADPPDDIWGVTKYLKEKIGDRNYNPAKKTGDHAMFASAFSAESPLVENFSNDPDFNGFEGGDFGGGGASSSWEDAGSADGADAGGCSGGGD